MDFGYMEDDLRRVRAGIEEAAAAFGRDAGEVVLLAAVKSGTPEELDYLHRVLGVNVFGENRVQQFLSHYEALNSPDLHWHFIGSLQKNKVKYIIDKVDMIQSLDSVGLAAEIERQAVRVGRVMDVLIEINCGREAAKGGVMPEEAEALALALRDFPHIKLRGFMTMAPKCENSEKYTEYFRETYNLVLDIWVKKLHNIREELVLSMGMSQSYREAVACGSTMVRVGRSLFAGRPETGENGNPPTP